MTGLDKRRQGLIERIQKLEDADAIRFLEDTLSVFELGEPQFTQAQQEHVLHALQLARQGRVKTHAEVMAKYRSRYDNALTRRVD